MALEFKPKIAGFVCNWCVYGAADLCGVSRLQYTPETRLIRVMCSGRVDISFILKAFLLGIDGVFVGGCELGGCHYSTHGNFHAFIMGTVCKKIMELIGLNPVRLRMEWLSAGEGVKFSEIMNDFGKEIRNAGPIGVSEGMEDKELQFKLKTILNLVPYIRLVIAEKMRVPVQSEEEYRKYFNSEDFKKIFDEMIADKIIIEEIVSLLKEGPKSSAEIANALKLSPADASKYIKISSKLGVLNYDSMTGKFIHI